MGECRLASVLTRPPASSKIGTPRCIAPLLVLVLIGAFPVSNPPPPSSQPQTASKVEFVRTPMLFTVNDGQLGEGVDYGARGRGYTALLSEGSAVLQLRREDNEPAEIRMTPLGARTANAAIPLELHPSVSNHYKGNVPANWHVGLANYQRVEYPNVYDGIALAYYGNQHRLEYDFIVEPGADPDKIRVGFEGVDGISIEDNGGLLLSAGAGDVRFEKPYVYQEIAGERQQVPGEYLIAQANEVRFKLGVYDAGLPLVIDPTLVFAGFIGSTGGDEASAVATDSSGGSYVAGLLNDASAFVAMYDNAGVQQFLTTMSSTVEGEIAQDIAVDISGNSFICGLTTGTDFPTGTAPVSANSGLTDYFVTKLTSTGMVDYSTYVGGAGNEGAVSGACAITVDTSGDPYLAGDTPDETGLGVTDGPAAVLGTSDAFVAKLTALGALDFLHLIGGAGEETAAGVGFKDDMFNEDLVYVVGSTDTGFPAVADFGAEAYHAGIDTFLVALDATPSIVISTFIGGTGDDIATSASSVLGRIAIGGTTTSVGLSNNGSATDADFAAIYDADDIGGPFYVVSPAVIGYTPFPMHDVFLDDSSNVLFATVADGFPGAGRLNDVLEVVDIVGLAPVGVANGVTFGAGRLRAVGSTNGSFVSNDGSTFGGGVSDAFLLEGSLEPAPEEIVITGFNYISRVNPSTGNPTTLISDGSFSQLVGIGIAPDSSIITTQSDVFLGVASLNTFNAETGAFSALRDYSAGGAAIGAFDIEENGDIVVTLSFEASAPQVHRYDVSLDSSARLDTGDLPSGAIGGFRIERGGATAVLTIDDFMGGVNHEIRRFDLATGTHVQLGVTGSLDGPQDVAIEADGDFVVANRVGDNVLRIDQVSGAQVVLSAEPSLNGPIGVAAERDGSLLVTHHSDEADGDLYRIDAGTGVATRFSPPDIVTLISGFGMLQRVAVVPWEPTLTSISADPLPLNPGIDQNVTFTGEGFIHTSKVMFGASELANVTPTGPTTIDAVIPFGLLTTAGPVSVTIDNPAPRGGSSPALMVMVGPTAPTLGSISPDTALKGDLGFTITLTGTGFSAPATVNFDGGNLGNVMVNSTMEITAAITTGGELDVDGVFPISVTTAGGTSGTVNFTVENQPAFLTSLTPNFAAAGTTDLMVQYGGNDFDDSAVATFDALDLTTVFGSENLVTGTVPTAQLATPGVFLANVRNGPPGGGSETTLPFTVTIPFGAGAIAITEQNIGVSHVHPSTGVRTPQLTNPLFQPYGGISATADDMFGVLQENPELLIYNPATGQATSIISFTPPSFAANLLATAVAVEENGDILVGLSDALAGSNGKIVSVDPGTGVSTDVANISAEFAIFGIAVEENGDLVITLDDGVNYRLAHVDRGTGTITELVPGGGSTAALLNPHGVAIGPFASGDIFVANAGAGNVVRMDRSTLDITEVVDGFTGPVGVKFEENGDMLVLSDGTGADGQLDRVAAPAYSVKTQLGPGTINNAHSVGVLHCDPSLTMLSPNGVVAGSGDTAVTVTGSCFNHTTRISFDGGDLGLGSLGGTSAVVNVPAVLLTNPGAFAMQANNKSPWGGMSGTMNFTVSGGPNPVPTVSSVSPLSATRGDPAVPITVTGTNFVLGVEVLINGAVEAATTFVNATTATSTIPASLLNAAGTLSIRAENPLPGGGVSGEEAQFTVLNPDPTLTSISPIGAPFGTPGPLTVTLTGSNFFNAETVVLLSGVLQRLAAEPPDVLPTTVINSSTLEIDLPGLELTSVQAIELMVFNPMTAGTGLSSSAFFGVLFPLGPGDIVISERDDGLSQVDPVSGARQPIVDDPELTPYGGFAIDAAGRIVFLDEDITPAVLRFDPLTSQVEVVTLLDTNFFATAVTIEEDGTILVGLTSHTGAQSKIVAVDPVTGFTTDVTSFSGLADAEINGLRTESSGDVLMTIEPSGMPSELRRIARPGGADSVIALGGVPFDTPKGLDVRAVGTLLLADVVDLAAIASPFSTNTSVNGGFSDAVGVAIEANGDVLVLDRTSLGNPFEGEVIRVDAATLATSTPLGPDGIVEGHSIGVYACQPTITGPSVSPTTLFANSGDGTFVTIPGSCFTDKSVLTLGGQVVPATPASATGYASVIVPESLLTTGGTVPLLVSNPDPRGGVSNAVNITIENPAPTLTSLNITIETAGATSLAITATGTGFTPTSVVTFGGIAVPTTFINATTLIANLGAAQLTTPGNFLVGVSTPAPGGGDSGIVNFTVINGVPVITSIAPDTVPPGGPDVVITVAGVLFAQGAVVNFDGVPLITTFINSTTLQATVPAALVATAGTSMVTVTNGTPGGGVSGPLPFTIDNPIPILISAAPAFGCLDGGDLLVTLFGGNFNPNSVARLGAVALAGTLVDPETLTVVIPANSLAVDSPFGGTVTVTNSSTGSDSEPLAFPVNGPALTGVSPTTFNVGGGSSTLMLSGTCLVSGATGVWDGGSLPTTFAAGTLTSTVASGLVSAVGSADVSVLNPSGATSATSAVHILGLVSVDPDEVNAGSTNRTVTVTGGGFVPGSTVLIGGSAVATTFGSATSLSAKVSASALATPGALTVRVRNPDGVTSNGLNLVVGPVPVITGLQPSSALAGDPDPLLLSVIGENFLGFVEVLFGGERLTPTSSSRSRTTVVIPPEFRTAPGFAPVQILPFGGSQSNPFAFESIGPVIGGAMISLPQAPGAPVVAPSQGVPVAVMVVSGTGFATDIADVAVTVGGNAATVISTSSTQIVASVALADALPGATVIVTNFGTVSSAPVVAAVETVTLTSLVPAAVTQGAQGVQLVINGQGFAPGATVDFGGAVLDPIANTGSSLTVMIPDSFLVAATVIPVAVITPPNVRSGELAFLVNPGLSLTTALPPAMVGEQYTTPLETTGGTGGLTFLAPSGLPQGLVLDPGTGILSGVATTPGGFFFDVVIADEGGIFASQRYELQVIGGLFVPSRLSFELGADVEFDEQILALTSVDAEPIDYTAETETDFLLVDAADMAGSVNPGAFATVLVRANRDGRGPGVYQGSLRVNDLTGGFSTTQTVVVNMTVNPSDPVLRPSQTGLTFIGALDGPAPADQTFGMGNRGSATLNWQIEVDTQGTGDWIEIEPLTGVTAPLGEVPLVNVAIDPAGVDLPVGLEPLALYAQLTLTSPEATNSPEQLTVVFDLGGAGGSPAPTVDPHGLLFRSDSGGEISPQSVRVSNGSNTPVNVAVSLGQTTLAGGGAASAPGFVVDLAGSAVGGLVADSVDVQIEANTQGLEPGTYVNTLTFEFTSAAGALPAQQVTLLLIVPPAPVAPLLTKQQGVCTPSGLSLAFQGPGAGNAVKFGFPQVVRVIASDDCERPMDEGSISVAFSNGDPQLFLNNLRTGIWEGTWQQTSSTVEAVTLTAFANRRLSEALRIEGGAEITVNLNDNPASPPVILALTNSAGFREGSIAPGMLMSVFGTDLGFEPEAATSLPLSETLGGTSIQVGGGFGAMIFGSANQSNLQVPFETTPNTIAPVTIFRDDLAISNRIQAEVETAEPAVFVDGNTLLSIVTNANFQLVTPTRPVKPGDVLIAFMSGLGPVEPTAETGFGSPIPVAAVANPVRMLIDDIEVAPLFAGLTPGFVGLYQLNFIVPEGVSADGPPHVIIVVEVGDEASPEFRLPFARQAPAPLPAP